MSNQQISKPARPKAPKIFRCTGYGDCTMSFTRYEHLARHIRKHTGERPYKCHCNRTFSRLDNLRQHAQTVHQGEQPIYTTVLTPTMPGQLSQRVSSSENMSNNHSNAQEPSDCSFRLANVHTTKIDEDRSFDSNGRPCAGKLPTKSRYGSHKRRPHPIYVPESRINSAEVLSTGSSTGFSSSIPSSALPSAVGTITQTYLPASPLSADAAISMGPRTAPPTMGNYPKLMSPNSMPPLAYAMLNSPYPGQAPPLGTAFIRGSYPRTPLSGYSYITTPHSGPSPGLSQYSLPYNAASNGSPSSTSQHSTGHFTNAADVYRPEPHSSITPTKTPLPQLSFQHSTNHSSSSHQRIPSMPTEILHSHIREPNPSERPPLRRGSSNISTSVLPDVRNLLNGPYPNENQLSGDFKIPISQSLRTSPESIDNKTDDFIKPRQSTTRMPSSHALKYAFDPIHDSLAQRSEAN